MVLTRVGELSESEARAPTAKAELKAKVRIAAGLPRREPTAAPQIDRARSAGRYALSAASDAPGAHDSEAATPRAVGGGAMGRCKAGASVLNKSTAGRVPWGAANPQGDPEEGGAPAAHARKPAPGRRRCRRAGRGGIPRPDPRGGWGGGARRRAAERHRLQWTAARCSPPRAHTHARVCCRNSPPLVAASSGPRGCRAHGPGGAGRRRRRRTARR